MRELSSAISLDFQIGRRCFRTRVAVLNRVQLLVARLRALKFCVDAEVNDMNLHASIAGSAQMRTRRADVVAVAWQRERVGSKRERQVAIRILGSWRKEGTLLQNSERLGACDVHRSRTALQLGALTPSAAAWGFASTGSQMLRTLFRGCVSDGSTFNRWAYQTSILTQGGVQRCCDMW